MGMSAAAFRRVICEILEPRILYSADPIATPTGSDDGMIPVVADRLQTQDHQALSTPDVTAQAALDAAFSPARLVVVDQRAFNAQALLEGLGAEQDAGRPIVVLELGLEDDAIERIAYAMSESGVRFGAVELHASAEGTSITLGSTSLDMATLRQRAFEFATWANWLESDAQIQVAQTSLAGAEITESLGVLGLLTGADVAVAPSERELVIIDSRVTDIDGLTRALLADQSESRRFELVVLGENENGIETIGRLLAGRQDLAAVHVLAHGASGVIELGASRIDLEALERYREAISGWSAALGENADLLLYGCDVGDGENGQAFARRLAELSGADVALSTDLTGSTALGGNWVLESHIGSIETRALFDRQEPMWLGTLAVVDNGSVATAQSTNTNSLSFFHTVNAGSDRMLIVTIAIDGLGANVTSVTYGGAALTQIGRGTGNHAVEIWGLVAPPVGTTDVVISLAGNSPIAAGATTFNGVDQASPTYGFASTSGLGTTASVTVASNTADRVVDVYYWDDNPAGNNVGAGQTLSWWASNAFLLAGSTTEPGAASVTMSTSVGSSVQWNAAAVSLRAGTTNQPPMINLPVAQVVNEDTSLVFSTGNGNAISISDPDAGASPMELTVGVTQGTLSLATTAGLTFLTGDGVADGIMSFRGTLASINAALDGLSYLAPTNYNGAATLSVSTRDGALVSLEIDANLQARYTFDGNPNDVAPGVAQHGTAMNGATYVADGTRGQVLSLDGVDDYVQIGSTFSNPTEITIGGWVNLLSAAGRSEFITLNDRFHIALDDGGAGVKGSVQTGAGSWQDLTSGTSIAGTGWHHVMYTYSDTADTHQLYIDGVLVASAAANLSPYWFGATETRIGAHPSNINFAHARVDDVRIYNRALTSAEVSALASDLTLRDSENLAITVNAVNDAPVVGTTGAPLSYTENALATAIDPNLTVTDVDSVNLTSASVSVSANYVNGQDLLGFTNQLGITGSWNTTTGVLTLSGSSSVANYQTALRSVTYRNLSDAPSTAARTVSFSASDGSLGSNVATRAINVQSINDPPVNAVPGAQATIEDTALVFSVGNGNAITISDLDVGANPSGITLSVSNGTLTLATVAGLTFTSGDGTADSTMSFSGTLASINAALNGLTYNPTSSYSGGAVLTVSTLDGLLFALDIDANLHAHYSFDGNANDVAPGASQNGVLTNGASIGSDGTRGQVLSLDGANDFVDLSGATASFAGFNQGTITGWIRATGAYSTIFSVSDTADSGSYASLFLGASGYLTFEVVENGVMQLAVYRSSAAINDGNWHHVAVAVGPGGNTLYVDGVQASAGQLTFDAGNASTQHFFSSVSGLDFAAVGRTQDSAGGKWHTLGSLDDVRVYSRALTAGEIQSLATDLVLRDADTVNITVAPINDSPVIAGLDGDLRSYTEGAAPVLLGSTSGITDPDSANFDTGTLTVSFTSGSDSAEDVLGIRNEGTGAGQIGVSVSNVTYGGVVIGTWSGGSGGTSLVVTLNSSANQTNVAALINNLTYFNTDDANPTTTTRNIRVVLTDGDGGTSANNDTSMTVAAANDGPAFVGLDGAPTYVEGGAAVVLDGNVTVTDIELSAANNHDGATLLLQRNGGANADDQFSATGTLSPLTEGGALVVGGTTIGTVTTQSAGTLLLSFNASATSALVNSALQQIAYANASSTPPSSVQINWSFSDGNSGGQGTGGALSASGAITVSITTVDVAPTVTTTGSALVFPENNPATEIDPGLLATDSDSANLTGATVTISANYVSGEDVLGFTNQLGITGSWNAGTGVLTLSGVSSVANYQTALRSVTYLNGSENPSTATRTVSFVLDDGSSTSAAATRDITVAAVNDIPTLTVGGTMLGYTENDLATTIDPGLLVSDVDNANLAGATVSIVGNYVNGEDVLGFVNQLGITGSWNAASGVLTLSGVSSVANYQTALRSITYLNISENPSSATRTIAFVADDGLSSSNVGTRDISIAPVNDAPVVVTSGGSAAFVENGGPVVLDPALTVADADSTMLAGAVVRISANYMNGEDILAFTNQNGISGAWNATTGELTLSGVASLANYQAALRTISYANLAENPSAAARIVSIEVSDGTLGSIPANRTVTVTPVNDAPVLATSGAALAYGEADPPTAIDPGLTIADVDSGSLIAATVSISANYVNGEDLLAFTNQLGISGSWNAAAGVLTLSGNASIANYQTALRSVTYFNGSSNPSVAPRTISFEVDDGTDASLPATRGINLMTLNDAPVVTTTGTSLSYTENDPATAIDPALSVSDVDSPTLSGAIVTISANYANGQDVLAFTDQLGITGSWNAGTGTLTLSGVASVANYQTALRSVTYLNGSDNPNPLTRTVSFSVNDGATVSSASTRGVVLTAVNDPPSSPPVTLAGVAEDSGARLITQAELLANATDVDSAGLVATGLAITSGMGSLIDNGDGTWSYTPAANDDTAVTYSYSVSDGSLSVAASASLDLLPVNDPPQTSPVILASHPEDGGGRLITQAELLANASDTEGAALTAISLAISSGAGSLFNNGNGTWTYLPAADDSSAVSFSYLVSDAGLSATGSATLDLTPVNDAPLITTPTSLTLAEDSALAFGLAAGQVLQVFDVDAAGGTLRVSIGASNGLLTLGNRSGLSFIAGSGTGDRTMAFEGTMAAINLALDSLVYNPDANFNGNDSLSLQVDDLGNSGIGGPALATRTVQLVVAPANDPPAIVAPALVSGTEDTAVEFSAALGRAILLTDVDAGAQSIRLELATTGGTLRFANTAGLSVISGSTSAGNQVVVTGTLADLNAALAGLWFDPLGDYSGSATLSLRVDDQGATGAGAAFATNANIVIAIAAVNDAPTELARAPAIVVVESAAAGTSVGRIEVSDVDDTGGFSFSLLDDAGHFAIDPVTGEIMVASSQLPAYDLAPGYSIIVRAVDPSGAQIDRAFVIQAVRREVVPPPPQAREVGQTLKADRADSGKAERELVPVSDSENERERFVVAGDDADPRRRAAISQGGLTGMRRALDHSRASVTQDEAMRANDEAAARAAQSAADERLRRLSELRSNFRLLDFDRLKENDGGLGGNHESGMMARVPEQWLGRDSQDADARRYEAMIESVHVGGVALSIGLIMYAVRAGGLAAAMLTAIPAWQTMDPLAVLARDRNRDRAVAWQDDPDDEARMDDRAVGQVIDGGGQSEFTSTHYTTRGS